VPRFVNKNGSLVPGRNWSEGDLLVDTDEDAATYQLGAVSVQSRDKQIPLMGVRKYSTQPAMQTLCTKEPDQNEDDFILKGYETCALQFSSKQFELS
jgi:hypothetical protein